MPNCNFLTVDNRMRSNRAKIPDTRREIWIRDRPVIPRGHNDVTVAGDSNLKHNFPLAHQQKVRYRVQDVEAMSGLPICLF